MKRSLLVSLVFVGFGVYKKTTASPDSFTDGYKKVDKGIIFTIFQVWNFY